jgi:NAD+ kinase
MTPDAPSPAHVKLNLQHIGVLLREDTADIPVHHLRTIFDRVGARVHVLNDSLPEEALDLVIAMGGDGTVLKALDLFPNCPVLAVNFGTVGFLTAGDRGDLERLVFRLLANDYILSDRVLLRCEHPCGVTHAINEVVLRSTHRMISVDVFVNGARIRTIRGDGVIAGTPTGSTGYLLSTGAPLVMPDVSCFILDGINEYNFSSRALILAPDAQIRLHLTALQQGQEAQLVIDGVQQDVLREGQELLLQRSERRAQLIFFDQNYFFHNLSSRLAWN